MNRWGKGRGGRPWRRLVEAVKLRDKYTCYVCGRITEDGECDHKIPESQGGKTVMDNLGWICRTPCHERKTLRESGVVVRASREERRLQPGDHWSR